MTNTHTDLLETIVRRYGPAIHRKCARFLRYSFRLYPSDVLEDLVQDTYVRVLQACRGGDREISLEYVYRAANSCCIDHFRQRMRQPEMDEAAPEDPRLSHQPGPRIDQRLALRQVLGVLDEREAQTFVMSFVDGMTQAEIAEVFSVTERTVRNILTRARAKARGTTGGEGEGNDTEQSGSG